MKKNNRWLIAQSSNYYRDVPSYMFLMSKAKRSGDVVWDMDGGEWELDGVGHLPFRLELFS